MMKEKAQTLVTDQLYNLVAGFLYALSICYFAKGADFAPGGLSGLALLGNYLWGFPIGITTPNTILDLLQTTNTLKSLISLNLLQIQ